MATTIKELNQIQVGTQIKLSDFHTLEATGGDETVPVVDVNQWSVESLNVFGFTLEVDEETTLMLMARCMGNEVSDVRLFREIESCLQEDCGFGMINSGGFVDDEELEASFESFSVTHDGEEEYDPLEYAVSAPFPFWGVRKNDGNHVALCEYMAVSTEESPVEENYWAKYGFVEWYSEVGEDGSEGLRTLWFGWDINDDDFDVI